MEIKVNDYVRTKDGRIEKYSGTNDSEIENFTLKDIIKSSPLIIDLIEVGDYVNGEKVIALEKDIDKRNIYPSNIGAKIFTDYEMQGNWYFGIQEKDIKSIVTKEQFEQMEYKID